MTEKTRFAELKERLARLMRAYYKSGVEAPLIVEDVITAAEDLLDYLDEEH